MHHAYLFILKYKQYYISFISIQNFSYLNSLLLLYNPNTVIIQNRNYESSLTLDC